PGLQLHLGESFEFFFRALQARLLVSDVHLHDFFARSLPSVGNIERHRRCIVWADLLGTEPERTIAEGGIGEAEAKGEQRRDFFLVIVAVADEESLPIVDLAVFAM